MAHRGGASLSMAGLVTPNDLIRFAMDQFHARLEHDLMSLDDDAASSSTTPVDRIQQAIQLRLGYQRDYMESQTWHSAMALGASPDNVLQTQQQLQSLMEFIVQHAYDSQQQQQQPISELAKLTLGGVYVATELHMLTDKSVDYVDSWAFLKQRLGEWEQATGLLSPSGPLSDTLYVTSAVATAFASGAASILFPVTSMALANAWDDLPKTASDKVWSALVQNESNGIDATDPRFYKSNGDNKTV